MKYLLACFFLILSYSVSSAQESITNADVISMIKAGFSPEVVTTKIKRSGGKFDTTPNAMKDLKTAGVPESVIIAMIESDAPDPKPGAPAPTIAAPAKPNQVVLKDASRIEIELAYTVSSADLKEGDAISFLTVHPVEIDGVVVIERGAPATARVVKAEGGKSWARGGQLSWAIQSVAAVDGQKVPLQYSTGTKGNGSTGTMTTGLVVTGLLFWPAAPLWGFKKGKPAVIPAGKRFEVFVHET